MSSYVPRKSNLGDLSPVLSGKISWWTRDVYTFQKYLEGTKGKKQRTSSEPRIFTAADPRSPHWQQLQVGWSLQRVVLFIYLFAARSVMLYKITLTLISWWTFVVFQNCSCLFVRAFSKTSRSQSVHRPWPLTFRWPKFTTPSLSLRLLERDIERLSTFVQPVNPSPAAVSTTGTEA